MSATLRLAWRDGVSVEYSGHDELHLQRAGIKLSLRQLSPAIFGSFQRLDGLGSDEDELSDCILDMGGPSALASWYHKLNELSQRGLLCHNLVCVESRLITVVPLNPSFKFLPLQRLSQAPVQLSRFACLRREGESFVVESPLAPVCVTLHDTRVMELIAALAKPQDPSELRRHIPWPSPESTSVLLQVFVSLGLAHATNLGAGKEELPSLQTWEFHDLLFHSRIRQGRTDAPYGATYRFLGQFGPPPAIKETDFQEQFELFRPDLARLGNQEAPFVQIVEGRRSIREFADQPITVGQLGEFLYRVARVTKETVQQLETPQGTVELEFAHRLYPGGGGLYELEVYAAVQYCDGLDPGLYHYNPRNHRLGRVCGRTPDFLKLVADAASSAGIPPKTVQIVLILSSRFQRMAWKYASIAYALTLKHVGVIYQTMYLTATAMRLAPCALGGGNSDLFARAAGLDYFTESSVGEFLLGSQKR